MKAKSSNVHNVNSKQLGKDIFRHTLNQSMKDLSFHAQNVNKKQQQKEALGDT